MSNFETWWESEGQEFLYALNTTTDDDIKLVAEVAWKNGAYCAEQAEQEPVGDGICLTAMQHPHNCCVLVDDVSEDSIEQVEQAEQERMPITKPVVPWYDREDSTNVLAEPAEQEPNTITFRNDVQNTWVMRITADQRIEVNEGIEVTEAAKLVLTALEPMLRYAAPVRTKDLTDDEIVRVHGVFNNAVDFARAVIAADREKNRG